MKENPVFYLLDLTEIYNTYIKEVASLLEMGINIRDVLTDIIMDSSRYTIIFKMNSPEFIRDSLVRYIVNTSGATKFPYREAVKYLKEYQIEMLIFSILAMLIEILHMPIKNTCIAKNESRHCIGIPRILNGYMVLIPVWFGTTVLPLDTSI